MSFHREVGRAGVGAAKESGSVGGSVLPGKHHLP